MQSNWQFVDPQEASLAWLQQLWNDPLTLQYTADGILWGEPLLRHVRLNSWHLACHSKFGPVGLVAFHRFEPNQENADLRFRLHPKQRGKGLAYTMTNAWMAEGPKQVQAQVRADHWRSKRLLRRLGFCLKKGFAWGGAPWELWELNPST